MLRDSEPFVAVVAQLETRVEEMEQLEVQFVQLWRLAKLTEQVVAELPKKFESRVTNLEQWGDTIAECLNARRDFGASLVMRAPPAGGGIRIPGRAEANGLAALVDFPVGN